MRTARIKGCFAIWASTSLLTNEDACLRTAEQLIAGEANDIGSRGVAFLRRWLVGHAIVLACQQTAAAEIVHHQQVVRVGQFAQGGKRRGFGEACYDEVARMDAQQERGAFVQRGLVIADARAVGRADLNQLATALAHHVGDAEATANLHQLPTRDNHLAAHRQRAERQ